MPATGVPQSACSSGDGMGAGPQTHHDNFPCEASGRVGDAMTPRRRPNIISAKVVLAWNSRRCSRRVCSTTHISFVHGRTLATMLLLSASSKWANWKAFDMDLLMEFTRSTSTNVGSGDAVLICDSKLLSNMSLPAW
ncbi:hypothetical protein DQ04_08291000 [Trypanosoma grayi]|uniref:hypothetical protein n=1 Tax=Trypanosoma grayi TaxID=71804 RepID=UPI0004F4225E|nr:hypothetical protein DQ04_08291000 [Trypanosoma grayi]KEG07988.1 hypothetical protein DQ04_08291000 [Trypanosoma grayi]